MAFMPPHIFESHAGTTANSAYIALRNAVEAVDGLSTLQHDLMAAQAAAIIMRRTIMRLPPGHREVMVPMVQALIDPSTPETCEG